MDKATHEPTTLVMFGATGDLAKKKLLPALFHLWSNGYLPDDFSVVGTSHDNISTDDYRRFAKEAIATKSHAHRADELEQFVQHLHYQSGRFEDESTYTELGTTLSALDDDIFKRCSSKLFYLAVPPKFYLNIFEHLATSGLTIPCGGEDGWTRVLVEKPFGRDLTTAQELDQRLGELFKEEQIFRIDHYLAKETVQNLITFRFANALFEPVWNHEYIDQVHILVSETIGVGERGSFYEANGALRDVGQNHILQMMALIAMEDPRVLEATAIRRERTAVLEHLTPPQRDEAHPLVRGQYDSYRDEDNVDDASNTETYFKLTTTIDNDRWRDVPFVLESGKRLAENKVEITITFKEKPSCVCPPEDDDEHRNVLTIRIQPDEGISLRFWAKKPGLTQELEPKTLSFFYNDSEADRALPDAYEKVLFDCIRGDQTLFASTSEVAAAWAFITPIIEQWHDVPLQHYEAGSPGPAVP